MKKYILNVLAIALLSGMFSCKMDSSDPYVQKIKKARFSKDSFYKSSPESPMDPKAKKELIALDYYEPDSTYHLTAHLELFEVPKSIMIMRTNSAAEEFYNLGNVVFKLKGTEYKLPVYQSAKYVKDPALANELFCPFTDETNGKETYKSGRFMDLTRKIGNNDIELDFNMAYNPYCAYNHDYNCPIPPPQSHLNTRIEAGEKAYKKGRFSLFK
jgi:uncharacterized protein